MLISYFLKRWLHSYAALQKNLVALIIVLEALFRKKIGSAEFIRIPFRKNYQGSRINLKLILSYRDKRFYRNKRTIAMINFAENEVLKWRIDPPEILESTKCFFKHIIKYKAAYFDISSFFFGIKKEHSTHMSPDTNYLCTVCGYYTHMVDVKNLNQYIFPENYLEIPMLYCETGCFSKDGYSWFTVRWPLENTIDIIDGKRKTTTCQILKVNLMKRDYEILGSMEYSDFIHQIACSPDGEYLVIASFKQDLYIDYPKHSIYKDPEGYRRSHEKGIKPESIVTFEIKTGNYWFTDIPTPAPAHPEFDIDNPRIFYISAHNMKLYQSTLFLEGNGAIYKLEIEDGKTQIKGHYTNHDFYRITQPDVFKFCGKTYIAVTNTPDKLDIIDSADMSLVKSVLLINTPQLDFSVNGSAIAPESPDIFYSANATDDGRFVVLGSGRGFLAYDMQNGSLIDLSEYLPEFTSLGLGHPKSLGR